MNALDIFNKPELEPGIHAGARVLIEGFAGVPVPLALAMMFQAWLVIAKMGETDPGVEFERLLATWEDRQMTTHRATLAVH